jgi:hypothetical protein
MIGKTKGLGAKKGMRDEKNKEVVGKKERRKRNREVHRNEREKKKRSNYKGGERKEVIVGV